MVYPWRAKIVPKGFYRAPIKPRATQCKLEPGCTCSYEDCPQKPASYSHYLQKSEDCINRRTDR